MGDGLAGRTLNRDDVAFFECAVDPDDAGREEALILLDQCFDRAVVNDTGVNGSGEVTSGLGFILKFQQTGKLPNYALGMILGVTLLAVVGFTVKG